MLIRCPSCSTDYKVNALALMPSGRRMRCSGCGHGWIQLPPHDIGYDDEEDDDEEPSVQPTNPQNVPAPPPIHTEPPDLFNWPEYRDSAQRETEAAIAQKPSVGFEESAEQLFVESENLQDRPAPRRIAIPHGIGWAVLILFIIGSLCGTLLYRNEIVSFWPATAKLYAALGRPVNIQGVEFRDMNYEWHKHNNVPVLTVSGDIVNIGMQSRTLPDLRVSLSDNERHEVLYWTVAFSPKPLDPEQSRKFTTDLPDPPPGAKNIEVRFLQKNEEAHPYPLVLSKQGAEDKGSDVCYGENPPPYCLP